MKQLILTADDFGLSRGINETTLELHRRGAITTASLMLNFPETEHAAQLLRENPTLQGGVHLNATEGLPITDPAHKLPVGLRDYRGKFHHRAVFFARGLLPNDEWLQELETEFVAQIEDYTRLVGKPPGHITTHMHFHMMPALRDIVLRLAESYEVAWVRAFEPESAIVPFNFLLKQASTLFHGDDRKITPDYIAAVLSWQNLEPFRLVNTLRDLDGICELVVHPDREDDEMPPGVLKGPKSRAEEAAWLLRFLEALEPHRDEFLIADPAATSSATDG